MKYAMKFRFSLERDNCKNGLNILNSEWGRCSGPLSAGLRGTFMYFLIADPHLTTPRRSHRRGPSGFLLVQLLPLDHLDLRHKFQLSGFLLQLLPLDLRH